MNDFFYERKENLEISDSDIQDIKNLVSSKHDDSGYYSTYLKWTNKSYTKDRLKHLYVCVQFGCFFAKMSDEFIKENNIKSYHIEMIRNLYLDFDDEYGDDNYISMGFKRPFGNSNVAGDIEDILINNGVTDISSETSEIVLLEFIDILDLFIKNFDIPIRYFERCPVRQNNFSKYLSKPHYNLLNFRENIKYKRNDTIDSILN